MCYCVFCLKCVQVCFCMDGVGCACRMLFDFIDGYSVACTLFVVRSFYLSCVRLFGSLFFILFLCLSNRPLGSVGLFSIGRSSNLRFRCVVCVRLQIY